MNDSGAYRYTDSQGDEWYLHGKVATLRNGHKQQIYWFARAVDLANSIPEIPEGFEVMETARTGMPVLRKF